MNYLKKVKSFTILELIIAMVIGSVVMTIVYYTLTLIHRQLFQAQETRSLVSDYLLLNNALQKDFDTAHFVQEISEREIVFFYENKTSVAYRFLDNCTVRSLEQHIDSFHLPVTQINLTRTGGEEQLVARLSLQLKVQKNYFHAVYSKHYSAKDLLLAKEYFNE